MTRLARLFPLLPVLCLAACSGSGDAPVASAPASQDIVAAGRQRSGDLFDDDYKKIQNKFGAVNPNLSKDGTLVSGQGKTASEFDRNNAQFKGRWDGKAYKAGDYKKKSWWGDRDYAKKVYGGDTDASDLVKRSRFDGNASNEGKKVARDDGRSYATGNYATGASNEMGRKNLAKTSDAETDIRRDVFTDPEIMPYQQQNGMTLDEVKQRLGR